MIKNFGESSCIPVWRVIQNYHRVYFVLEHHSLIHRKRSETVKKRDHLRDFEKAFNRIIEKRTPKSTEF